MATSTIPVGRSFPPPTTPTWLGSTPRYSTKRSRHWSTSSCRSTSTSVGASWCAITAHAITVLPDPGGAAITLVRGRQPSVRPWPALAGGPRRNPARPSGASWAITACKRVPARRVCLWRRPGTRCARWTSKMPGFATRCAHSRAARSPPCTSPTPLGTTFDLDGQQAAVREEAPAGQLGSHHPPVALPAGVAAGPDGPQRPAVALADEAEMVEQLAHRTIPATPVTESSLASTTGGDRAVVYTSAICHTHRA